MQLPRKILPKGDLIAECIGYSVSIDCRGLGLDHCYLSVFGGYVSGCSDDLDLSQRKVIDGDPANNGVLKATAFLAPFRIISGLLILVFHLTKPLPISFFGRSRSFIIPTSVMSMGVILFQVYMVILFVLDRRACCEIRLPYSWWSSMVKGRLDFVSSWIGKLESFENVFEIFLAIACAITCGLHWLLPLSALNTFPMLNNPPCLPMLFLFSSLSSGAAACILFGVCWFFKESPHSASISWIHGAERLLVCLRLFVTLLLSSLGWYLLVVKVSRRYGTPLWRGGGFWASWFWYGT